MHSSNSIYFKTHDRYLYQGQEMDDEVKGEGNSVNYTFRMHDPRLGRFFAIDPLSGKYPWNSSYSFSENQVIHAVELEGLEAFLINGTNMNTSKFMFNKDAILQFERIGGNTKTDDGFSWGNKANFGNSRHHDRNKAAKALAKYVIKQRKAMLTNKNITEDEPITLIGYSHGGNVAIQAAELIEKATGKKVQIITYATPAYNDNSVEDPATNDCISKHVHIYSDGDLVAAMAGGDKTYNNGKTVNYKFNESLGHIDMGDMSKNKGLGLFLKSTIGKMSSLKSFNKTRDRVDPPTPSYNVDPSGAPVPVN